MQVFRTASDADAQPQPAGWPARASLALSTLLLIYASAQAQDESPPRPNVVHILVDDLGYSDLACYGGEIQTPNIDALAANGLRFSSYRTYPKCLPTRDALMTGMDAAPVREPADSITIGEALQAAGYRTYFVGKTHGDVLPDMQAVDDRGFDRSFGNTNGGSYWTPKVVQCYLDGEPYETDEPFYKTDVETDFALRFLDEHPADQPFFLHLAYHAPHFPIHAKPADIEKYVGKFLAGPAKLREARYARLIEMGMISKDWKLSPALENAAAEWAAFTDDERAQHDAVMASYAAMVDNVDQNVGRLIAKLQALGVEDNTLIVFSSDNGSCPDSGDDNWPASVEGRYGAEYDPDAPVGTPTSHWKIGRAWANLNNTPFQRYKRTCDEGGLSVPMIVTFPGRIDKPGSISHAMVAPFDLFPTILSHAGATYPAEFESRPLKPLRGIDLSPLFAGGAFPDARQFYFQWRKSRTFIDGDWKILTGRKTVHLFNLKQDRTELNDLSATHPEKLKSMLDAAKLYTGFGFKIGSNRGRRR